MSKRAKRIINILVAAAVLAAFVIILLIQSGYFSKDPHVKAVADNCYDKTLHVITDQDYSPYSFYDHDGKYSGYDVELITLIANKLQMNLDLRFMSWSEGIAAITNGEADVLMTCDYSDSFEGVDKLIKSVPTSSDEFIVYSKKRSSSVSEMYGKRIAIMENGNVTPQMTMLGLLPYCIKFKDNRSAMQALADGEVDFAVMRQAVGVTLLHELNVRKVSAYFSAGASYMCFGINTTEDDLAQRINLAIEDLKVSGVYDHLQNKWLTTFLRPYTLIEVIRHNPWTLFLFILIVLYSVASYFRNKSREIKTTEQHEKQLQEALSMAQSANRAKTTFLNNMSHDIRTPMNAIVGYTGLAARHVDDKEKVLDYLEKIGKSSDHLLSLINDVLDMSRIESGKTHLEEKEENLKDIIHTLEDIVRANLKSNHFELDVDIKDENVICDKLRLNQILLNVVSNAIKYTPAGGNVQMKVTEPVVRYNGYGLYKFIVKDNGIGMSREFLSTIFEPFTRAKSTTVSGIQGTGLGMAITKNLVDMMGGSIDVQSEPDKGTCVTLSLEFKLADFKEGLSQERLNEEAFDVKGKKILLVEDNMLNREIASAILSELGCIVEQAEDGDVAVEKVKAAATGDYDIILMDVQMPTIDGYEATRQIRALGTEISKVPIIAMTANAFEEDRRAALDAGMNEHLTKPIDILRLKEVLSKFLM